MKQKTFKLFVDKVTGSIYGDDLGPSADAEEIEVIEKSSYDKAIDLAERLIEKLAQAEGNICIDRCTDTSCPCDGSREIKPYLDELKEIK